MSVQTLRELNDRLSTDDAPRWAEAIGMVFALGLTARSLCHITNALATDRDPQLAGNDVIAASPVVSLQDAEWQLDLSSRLLALSLAVVAWAVIDPLSATWPGEPWMTVVARAFVIGNIAVPAVDPVLFVKHRLTETQT